MVKKAEKTQLHQSMMGMAYRCEVAFQLRYGKHFGIGAENLVMPPGVNMLIGSATHESARVVLEAKMRGEDAVTPEEAVAVARDFAAAELAGGGVLYTESEAQELKETQGSVIDLATLCSATFYDELAPSIDPTAVEESFVVKLDDWPYDLGGRVDHETKPAVKDLKTAGMYQSADEPQGIQLTMYGMARKARTGRMPKRVGLDVVVKPKRKKDGTFGKVGHQRLELPFSKVWVDRFMFRFEQFCKWIDDVKTGKLGVQPAHPNLPNWVCTARFCGYHKMCKYWSGRE